MNFIKNKLSYKVTKMQDFIPFLTVKQDTIPIEVRPYSEDVIPGIRLFLLQPIAKIGRFGSILAFPVLHSTTIGEKICHDSIDFLSK